jgi:hypothetical protein
MSRRASVLGPRGVGLRHGRPERAERWNQVHHRFGFECDLDRPAPEPVSSAKRSRTTYRIPSIDSGPLNTPADSVPGRPAPPPRTTTISWSSNGGMQRQGCTSSSFMTTAIDRTTRAAVIRRCGPSEVPLHVKPWPRPPASTRCEEPPEAPRCLHAHAYSLHASPLHRADPRHRHQQAPTYNYCRWAYPDSRPSYVPLRSSYLTGSTAALASTP